MSNIKKLTRRAFGRGVFCLAGLGVAGVGLAGCTRLKRLPASGGQFVYTSDGQPANPGSVQSSISVLELQRQAVLMYGPLPDERFPVPAVHLEKLDSKYYRQRVAYRTGEKVGTLVVDTTRFFCYLVEENGMAMRYGVGLGRAGFAWSGRA